MLRRTELVCERPNSDSSRVPGALMSDFRGVASSRRYFFIAKRIFDLAASSVGIVVSIPIFGICALAIKLDSPGPVFYLQTRVGRHGHPFTIIKFRSMFVLSGCKVLNITAIGDPRVTRVGRWLRATKLDELPQLLNVFRGDMSLVGPRPEVPEYVVGYSSIQKRILDYRPGITGPASVGYVQEGELLAGKKDPDQFYRQYILPQKLDLDLAYCATATLMKDLRLLVLTICKVWLPRKKSVSSV